MNLKAVGFKYVDWTEVAYNYELLCILQGIFWFLKSGGFLE
jgi:hypothetical protein